MIGGEHRIALTDALLREWANLPYDEYEACFRRWLESNGGCLVQTERAVNTVAEDMEIGFTTGASVYQSVKVRGDDDYVKESYVWDELLPATAKPPKPPLVPLGTTWALVMHGATYGIIERAQVTGPRGGDQGTMRIGWHFVGKQAERDKAKFVVATNRPGIGGFDVTGDRRYAWLWGHNHVAMIPSTLASIQPHLKANTVFASVVASMLNEMLDKLTPANPGTVQAACRSPQAIVTVEAEAEDTTFAAQQAKAQQAIIARLESAKQQALEELQSAEAEVKKHAAIVARREKAQPADLNKALTAMLEKGLVSEIRKNHRGLWFLFDDIHAFVSPELIAKGPKGRGVEPGVYKVDPAVVYLPWGAKGSRWVCGTPQGGEHRHHHASINGGFAPPCLGDRGGGQGPYGMGNSAWFDLLWDTDPVKWAEFIHQFLGRTGYEDGRNYRPIWECSTLVKPLHPKAILKVKKLTPPKLLVKRTKPGTEPLPVDKDDHDDDNEEEIA